MSRRHAVLAVAAVVAVTLLAAVVAALRPDATPPAASAAAQQRQPQQHVVRRAAPAFPQPAWVAVTVATVWASPSSPRPVDRPALRRPADVTGWLAAMDVAQKRGLVDRVLTQALLGDRVVVLGASGGWRKVVLPHQTGSGFPDGIVGWLPAAQLSRQAPPDTRHQVTVAVPRAWLHAVRPDGSVGERTMLASYDTTLTLVSVHGGWLAVYVPGGGVQWLAASTVRSDPAARPTGAQIAREAEKFLGLPYLWAGTSAYGFDCSGLTSAIYRQFGVELPRDAADQAHNVPVDRAHLQPGDLLLFGHGDWTHIHHVGVYVGGGMMIDAPHTGASVEKVPVFASHWAAEFWGARRVLH